MEEKRFPVTHSDEEWRKLLTPEQYDILRGHGTALDFAGDARLHGMLARTNLFARVLEGSPAYRAGIRDGDEVLKVNGKDVPDWRTYGDSMESCCESPAGTELRFTLKRGETNFETTVVLHELLGPQR